jgi:hypothetical protein
MVPERFKKWITSSTMDNIIRWVVVASMVGLLYTVVKVQDTSDCLQRYIQANATSADAARLAASEDRKVIDTLVIEITQAKSVADTRAALSEYISRRNANDKFRAANPPPSSANVCS